MSHRPVESNQEKTKRDPDLVSAEVAMIRAAKKARQKARQVGAGVMVWKNGQVVEEQ